MPPSVTNIWLGVVGRHMAEILKHLWPLLLTDIITIWSTVGIMVATNVAVLTTVLGIILLSYAVYSLKTLQIKTVRPFGPVL